jgi:hypothetical protein
MFAEARGARVETQKWHGIQYFGITDASLSARPDAVVIDGASLIHDEASLLAAALDATAARAETLALRGYEVYRLREQTTAPTEALPARIDLDGLFMIHTRHLVAGRRFLEPCAQARADMKPLVEALRARGRTIVGLHLRRGDFESAYFRQGFELVTPVEWCLRWLEEHWAVLDRPVLLLCSDDTANLLPRFASYAPVTPDMLGTPPDGPLWARGVRSDWHLLTQCDQLLISNSTFSFTAAMASHGTKFFRPDLELERFVPFEPWEAEPLQFLPPRPLFVSRLMQVMHFLRLVRGRGAVLRALPAFFVLWGRLIGRRLWVAAKHGRLLRALFSSGTYLDTDVPGRIRLT